MMRPESGMEKFSRTRGQGDMQSTTLTQPLAMSPPANQACCTPTLAAHSTCGVLWGGGVCGGVWCVMCEGVRMHVRVCVV